MFERKFVANRNESMQKSNLFVHFVIARFGKGNGGLQRLQLAGGHCPTRLCLSIQFAVFVLKLFIGARRYMINTYVFVNLRGGVIDSSCVAEIFLRLFESPFPPRNRQMRQGSLENVGFGCVFQPLFMFRQQLAGIGPVVFTLIPRMWCMYEG